MSDVDFKIAKSMTKIPLECKKCGGVFYVTKKEITLGQKRSEQSYLYCSIKCRKEDSSKLKKFNCANCGKPIVKLLHEIKKNISGNFFCSQTCAAVLNNKLHKKRIKKERPKKERVQKPHVCSMCNVLLSEENCYGFRPDNKKHEKYSTCKSCNSKYVMDRWIKLKQKAINNFGGKCADCGKSYTYELYDFHHLDPSQKKYSWTVLKKLDEKTREKELSKCVLLCANCHRIRHLNIRNEKKKTNIALSGEVVCFSCGGKFDITHFYTRGNKKHTECKTCFNARCLKIKKDNKIMAAQTFGNICYDCKEHYPLEIFDFHHLDPKTKDFNWSYLKARRQSDIIKELEKCVMLCTNCHRLRHKEMHVQKVNCCSTDELYDHSEEERI